ncbi:PREDICTED: protein indeterminate-domain 2-like [Ipomoea nil]|uniref:protein indeterminate-domain 2-like n=1 Tax=Ipomoea nil TaxID=35883 RepID=UPI0009010AAC|nr:PREDICTED: protein indeterminate-domain 2-like [Ipomoea nil]XP_019174399.1 PREDICTED: protein indeterminate-domain 2-like [Ipomoea nil]
MEDPRQMTTVLPGEESAQLSEQTVKPKRKRSTPGMPDAEVEVIALSPKSLLETNRYVCDVCGKGFQREQNLQLHRRGHNLPWKLKQRGPEEVVKRRVYVCPETTCSRHHPSKALGDLSGIKKHFCRKHGHRTFKCEKCNKMYAVQCDWKAHMKTCGTRDYICDCGALFARKDSFIAHKRVCYASQALTVTAPSASPPPQPPTPSMAVLSPTLSLHSIQSFELPEDRVMGGANYKERTQAPSSSFGLVIGDNGEEDFSSVFRLSLRSGNEEEATPACAAIMERPVPLLLSTPPPVYHASNPPVLSATALLQKAAEMGSSFSSGGSFFAGYGLTMPATPAQWGMHANAPELALELALRPASAAATAFAGSVFSSHRQTLDFLGSNLPTLDFLGEANQSSSSSLLSSTSYATQFGMASSSSFGGALGDPWDGHADKN